MTDIRIVLAGQGPKDVPCGNCTKCCHGGTVHIRAHEDATQWKTEPYTFMPGQRVLAKHVNGDCVYLDDFGCSIHDSKPEHCHEMDCRNVATRVNWTQAKKMDDRGVLSFDVWRQGRDMLRHTKHHLFSSVPQAAEGI